MRAAALALVASAAVVASSALASHTGLPPGPAPAPAPPPMVRHQPPVDGPVVDFFRPPASPFGPGNRGVDYATAPGAVVRASGDGEVVFAGPVGGRLHVVVRHADGIRTSYSFLASVTVRRGEAVTAGQEVGRSGSSLHFGARRGDAYFDPLTLFGGGGRGRVHLVPDGPSAGVGRPGPGR